LFDLNQDWRVARRNAETWVSLQLHIVWQRLTLEFFPRYTDAVRHTILTTFELRYSNPFHGSGPYLLGEHLCVADLFTFQTLNELPVAIRNAEEEAKFPELVKLWKAVAARPGIAKLLENQKPGLEKLKALLEAQAAAAKK